MAAPLGSPDTFLYKVVLMTAIDLFMLQLR